MDFLRKSIGILGQNIKDCLNPVQNNTLRFIFFKKKKDECLVVELLDMAQIQWLNDRLTISFRL
jgi:hypothetical protein